MMKLTKMNFTTLVAVGRNHYFPRDSNITYLPEQ